jgi:hypothetical protein
MLIEQRFPENVLVLNGWSRKFVTSLMGVIICDCTRSSHNKYYQHGLPGWVDRGFTRRDRGLWHKRMAIPFVPELFPGLPLLITIPIQRTSNPLSWGLARIVLSECDL